MSMPVRLEIPGMEGSVPRKLIMDQTQAHGIAVQLEEQGFGYGAFWCKPPTVREALWILWSAIRGKELRTDKTPSMKPWAERVYYKYDRPPSRAPNPSRRVE